MKAPTRLFFPVLLIITMLLPVRAEAQQRSRFVFGVGISPGLTSFSQGASSEVHGSFGAGFKIGHEVDDRLQIYLSTIVSPFGAKFRTSVTRFGLVGITARYFLKEQTPSLFVVAGGDFGVWIEGSEFNPYSSTGPHLGVGYEFAEHVNIETSLSWLVPGHDDTTVSSFWMVLSYEI